MKGEKDRMVRVFFYRKFCVSIGYVRCENENGFRAPFCKQLPRKAILVDWGSSLGRNSQESNIISAPALLSERKFPSLACGFPFWSPKKVRHLCCIAF